MALNNLGLGFQLTAEDGASAVFDKAGQKLDGVKKKAGETGASLNEVSGEMQKMGKGLAVFGAAGIAGLGYAAHEAGRFQKSVAEVASIADKAEFPLSKINDIAMAMGQQYGGDLNLQAKTLYQAVSSGASTAADATALMHAANKLAIGGLSDSFKAVDAVTNVLNAYGMKMEEAGKVSDAMFVTAKIGKTTIDELAQVIGRVAPTAAAMGVSMDEMMAGITGASTQLGNATEAVTGLKAALAVMMHPSADATAEAARLGIKFNAAALKSKGLAGVLKDITGSSKYTAASLQKLFGGSLEAFNVISALAANNGKAFNDALTGMAGKAGATDDAFKVLNATYETQAGLLKTKLQVAIVKIGNVVLPLLAKLTGFVSKLVDAFNDLPEGVQEVIVGIAGFIFVGALVLGTIIALVGGAMALAGSLEAIAIALAVSAGIFVALVAAVGAAALVFYGFKAAYEKNLGGFATFVDGVWKKVKLAVQAVQQLFTDGAFSGDVLKDLENGNKGIEDFAVTIFLWWNRIKNFLSGIAAGWEAGINALKPTFDTLVKAFKDLGAEFGWAKDAPAEARAKWEAFGAAGAKVGQMLATAFGWVVKGITIVTQLATGIISGFKAAGPVVDTLKTAFGELWSALGRVVSIFTQATASGDQNANTWKTIGQAIGWVIAQGVKFAAGFVSSVAGVYNLVAAYVGGIVGQFSGMWTSVQGLFKLLKGLIDGDGAAMWYGFKMMVFGMVKAVVSAVAAMVEGIASTIDKLAKKVGKNLGLQDAVKGAKDAMLGDLEKAMGLDKGPPVAPTAGAPPGTTAPGATPAPAGAPGGPVAGALPPLAPATLPAVAGTGIPGAAAAAPGAAPPPPVNLNQTIALTLDGQKIAEAVQKTQNANGARELGPTPTAK